MYIGLMILGSIATSDWDECFEDEKAIEKLIRDTSPGIDQIPAEFIKAGRRTIRSDIHKFIILFGKRRNCV